VTAITNRPRLVPKSLRTRNIPSVSSFVARVSRFASTCLLPGRIAGLAAALLLTALPAEAAAPAGYTEYLVPFDEDVFVYITDPLVQATTDPIPGNYTTHSLIALTSWSDATVYVDHWENGYTYDPNNPDTTSDEKYTMTPGQALNFESAAIPRPRTGANGNTYIGAAGDCTAQPAPGTPVFRNTLNYCYDGRDRIMVVGGATTLTRAGWINSPNPPPDLGVRAAIGEEVYPLAPQLVRYILPFGEDATRPDYERVIVTIQATEDNTILQLDLNGDGAFDSFNPQNGYRTARTACGAGCLVPTLTLNRGETYVLDRDSDGVLGGTLNKDTVILGSQTLQVEYFYGEANSSPYNTRAVSAYPRGFWGREYYAPADGAAAGNTDVLVYNPDTVNTITINWQTTTGSGSFTLAPRERGFFQNKTGAYVPNGSGVYLRGTGTFWGTSDADTNSGNYDWGYSLVPSYLLVDDQTVAWAPGNYPVLACNNAEGRDDGIFIIPVQDNTTIFIDKNGDGVPDTDASMEVLRGTTPVTASASGGYVANRLESLYVTGSRTGNLASSPCDLTGAHIWATGPIAIAYGENPDKATAAGGSDLGYTVLPSPENWMDLALTVDKSTSPVLVSTVAGATTVTYTLVIQSHEFNIDAISVLDTLPANWAFDNNSATITLPDLTTITGAAANPTVALPNLTWGSGLLGGMLPNQKITITFTARTTAAFANGVLTRNQVTATGTRNVGGVVQTFKASDFVFNAYTDGSVNMQLTKTSSVPLATPVSPGDTLTYTVTVTNPNTATANLTGVWIYDTLPVGVTPVAGSTTLSRSSVADSFGTAAYTNSDGTRTWATNWTESADGGSATAGDVQVVAGELRLNNATGRASSILQRRANLAGATSAILSFNYRTTAGVDAADRIQVCGRRQSTDAWTCPLTAAGNFTGITGATSGTYSANLATAVPGGLTATAEISFQFLSNTSYTDTAANESFFVDNLSITYDVSATGGDPADILSSSSLYTLIPNQSLTATFNVTVDNPFPTTASDIMNMATSSAAQLPVTLSASARNIVVVPSGASGTVGDRVWLDTDADGVFDPGETGLGNVEVTLKDLYGTPLQVTTTDSQGRYTFIDVAPGTSYYVEITGGLPAGLVQTTDTVGDTFAVNGLFTGNNGTLNWLTNWTETGDDAAAATGDIRIANNRIEFRDTAATVAANESIQRSATVTGATSIEVQYDWLGTGLATGSDRVIAEYSTDGTTWTTLRTIDNAAAQTFTDTVAWTPTNNTFFLRYRTQDVLETNKLATIDNVQVRFPKPLRTAPFNLVAGQDYVQADLGFRAAANTASIGDLVWVDANNDQVRNAGEAGLAGITVQLYEDTNGDGAPDGAVVATAVTSAGGAYLFTNIPANGVRDWVVTLSTGQAPLSGYTATTPVLFYYANLASGAVRVDADFGFRNAAATFTITDGVWLDNGLPTGTAGNGVKDGTEAGIAGVTVDLLNSAGSTIATTTTAANGTFQFTGVPGGQNYSWRITDDAGVLADYYGTTAAALSGNFQITGNLTTNLDYTSPSDVRHFGYNQTRTIGDTVWNDNGAGGGTLGNGVQDGAEPGISGVTVLLYRDVNNNGVYEPGGADGAAYASRVTDASGHYLFAGLPSGFRWFVSIDNTQAALAGFNTLTTAADFDGNAANGQQRQVTPILTGGANRLDIDYGYRTTAPSTISGRLFSDQNRNGVDNSESGLAGVTVQLRTAGGVVVGTTTTAADGSYSFVGLPAATYTVQVTDTGGVLGGYETTLEKTEGALAASYNGQETVTVGPNVTDVNFGFYRGTLIVTRAFVAGFQAYDLHGAVALEWKTGSELGTVGFYVERWDEREARYVAANERLLPSLITSPQGGVYRYVDEKAALGEPYRYRLVEVEASGKRLVLGPWDVQAREASVAVQASLDADAALRDQGYSRTARRERSEARRARAAAVRADAARAERLRGPNLTAAKIGVAESAIHYVPLSSLGSGTGPLAHARLTNRGRPVAWAPSSDGNGILFYGRASSSPVERDNVYRFSRDGAALFMPSRPLPSVPSPTGAETYVRTLHVEQDAIAVPEVYKDPDGDYWVWDYVYAGFGAKSFTFRTDGAARVDPASITIRLKGGTDTPADPDHHATFSLNGVSLGEAYWDGIDAYETTIGFDASLLVDGDNTLTIDGLTDTDAPYSLFYLQSFDVRYTSAYRAYGNKLECPAAGHAAILISGFTRPDVMLFDVTVPTRPVIVPSAAGLLSDGTYGIVAASANKDAVFYAVAPDALASPARIVPDTPSALRRQEAPVDYLLITTAALREAAQSLADYRADLRSLVVDIEDVYDEFGDGIASPQAVKNYLTWLRSKGKGAPRYVVLVGDGSYDYKDRLGFGDNLIPPMMASTPSGLFASDAWFLDTRKPSATEPAIGRLPVGTSSELLEVIRKIQAREAAIGDPWLQSTLLVADDPDNAGNFPLSSEGLVPELPAGAPLSRAYLSVDGLANTRTALLGGIDQGTGLVGYFGHGGYDRLADEGLLTTADLPSLTNTERPTVLMGMTCLAGSSALPGYATLGEMLVRQTGGGAAAVWAPSGMSENPLAEPLAKAFFQVRFPARPGRIGDAIGLARRAYRSGKHPAYMLSIYNLLGDPAMRWP
jgi:uncharacterized repeat protein (TIGR01451 family)